jgi:RNA polymerase sporulation-specific sigma factor
LNRTTYEEMTDEDLVELARRGDDRAMECLIRRYRNLVRVRALSYFLTGADREDVVQEGMIGLYNAVRDYRRSRGTPFRAFAELCITRQIINAVRTATRCKHVPLNSYLSLDGQVFEDNPDRTLSELVLSAAAVDPEVVIVDREATEQLVCWVRHALSKMECRVLAMYMDGKSYAEMAAELGCSTKAVDNALQRIRRKAQNHLEAAGRWS